MSVRVGHVPKLPAISRPGKTDARAAGGIVTLNPEKLSELVVSIGTGDRVAFQSLYAQTSAKLLGVVIRIVRSRQIAEDVLQDVYVKVWTNARTFDPRAGSAIGWLVSIARNRAIDVVRANSTPLGNPYGDAVLETLPDGVDREAQHNDRFVLERCLGALDARTREVILLAYRDGYSREELAERLHAPVNTIKTWLNRGLTSLKVCMEA